jgi:hypothetical protein
MNRNLFALTLLLLLTACAEPCKQAPLQALPDSPFKKYRLGEVIIEPAADPEQTSSNAESEFQNTLYYKPLIYSYAEPVIGVWFSQPNDKGYAQAPLAHVVCKVETLAVSKPGLLANGPAEFAGTISLIDPGTSKAIISKRCEKKALPRPEEDKTHNFCDQSYGKPGLSNALNQCAEDFIVDMKNATIQPQPTLGATIDGTLVDVIGHHSIRKATFWEGMLNSGTKKSKDIIVNRIAFDMLPNAVKRAVVDSNTYFNNSSSKIYKIVMTIKNYDLDFSGIFSKGSLQYTSETTVYVNSMKLLSFDYTSPKFLLADREKEFAKHAKYILDYLKKNAQIQKP